MTRTVTAFLPDSTRQKGEPVGVNELSAVLWRERELLERRKAALLGSSGAPGYDRAP